MVGINLKSGSRQASRKITGPHPKVLGALGAFKVFKAKWSKVNTETLCFPIIGDFALVAPVCRHGIYPSSKKQHPTKTSF